MASDDNDEQLRSYHTFDVSSAINREARMEVLYQAFLLSRLGLKWTTYCSLGEFKTAGDFDQVAYRTDVEDTAWAC